MPAPDRFKLHQPAKIWSKTTGAARRVCIIQIAVTPVAGATCALAKIRIASPVGGSPLMCDRNAQRAHA